MWVLRIVALVEEGSWSPSTFGVDTSWLSQTALFDMSQPKGQNNDFKQVQTIYLSQSSNKHLDKKRISFKHLADSFGVKLIYHCSSFT